MAHTIRDRQKLLARTRRLRGQIEAVERALITDSGCEPVLHLLAGARGAMAGLMAEIVEDHIRHHLIDPDASPGALDPQAADTLVDLVRSYLR